MLIYFKAVFQAGYFPIEAMVTAWYHSLMPVYAQSHNQVTLSSWRNLKITTELAPKKKNLRLKASSWIYLGEDHPGQMEQELQRL